LDENELIEQLKRGVEMAGPILLSRIAPRLLGYANLIAADLPQADREMLVENAVEDAIRKIDRFDPEKGTFPAWVRGFLRYAVKEWRRANPAGAALDLDRAPGLAAPPDQGVEAPASPEVAAIAALVLTSPETDQLLLRLRFAEGLSHRQIAERLGVTEGASRKRLERVLGRLRERAAQDPDLQKYRQGVTP
jgi:RNA polymerase sigma-70 factor, ECF subfamily